MDSGNSTQNYHKCCSSQNDGDVNQVDRISNLPDSIIAYILSFLPTKSIVLTGLLSKSWRFHWTKVTNLNFDEHEWPSDERRNFVTFVHMVMLNHSGESINNFRLKCRWCHLGSIYYDQWIKAAIAQNVRALDLDVASYSIPGYDVYPYTNYFCLPDALYTCGTLEVLKLQGQILINPPNVVCLPNVSDLELRSVRYESDESFRKLLSGCLMLQTLKVIRTELRDNPVVCTISSLTLKHLVICFDDRYHPLNDSKLEIYAPALEYLGLHDSVSSKVSMQGLTSVYGVHLSILSAGNYEKDSEYYNMIVGIVETFDGVKLMKLGERTMMALSKANQKISGRFEQLEKLDVSFNTAELSCLFDFIGCCINLEVLHIRCRDRKGMCWRDPIHVPGCFSLSLKEVTFTMFDGLEQEMGLLKFILEESLVLERVYLCCFGRFRCMKHIRMMRDVSKLTRKSSICKIFQCKRNLGPLVWKEVK